jgi:hypothetical protein
VNTQVDILERMVRAVEKVRNRLLRATAALEQAHVAYAVIGGNAVAAWVASVDEAAVRNTQDVDILLDRVDFERAQQALAAAGFVYQNVLGVDCFLDGPDAKPRDAVHVVFADEKVRPGDAIPTPSVALAERFPSGMNVISLDALVRMKLTSFRRKDQMHLIDMIDVGLVGEQALAGLPEPLAERLHELLANPEG